jgi:subfamily B ATP-binding cassette protein MsbA
METLRKILSYARPYHKYWPKYLFFTLLGILFGLFNLLLVAPLLDLIFQTPDAQTQIVAQLPEWDFRHLSDYFENLMNYGFGQLYQYLNYDLMAILIFMACVIVLASFLANLFRYISQRVLVRLRADVMRNMRAALYRKISGLHIGYFHTRKKGDILSVVSNDVTEIQNTIISSFQVIFREPIMIVAYTGALFFISYRLTIFTLIALPITGFLIGGLVKKLRRYANKTQSILGQLISFFEEAISGLRIIKAFNAQEYLHGRFDQVNIQYRNSLKGMFNRQVMATPLSEFLGISVVALIVLYAGYLKLPDISPLTTGSFFVYFGCYYYLLTACKAVVNEIANIQRGLASAQRFLDIMEQQNDIQDDPDAVPLKDFQHSIDFDRVGCSYQAEPVLKDILLSIPKGHMVALVGPSGAGKTTMADLLPRFYDVTSGRICIDGRDIRKVPQQDLTRLMGIVTQEPVLFNDSVYQNIVFGQTGVTPTDVEAAARVANAHEFIEQLPEGYQTNIGDRGSKLSGGQRQRIAIARAVLKNPPILILDEAPSALDTESERLVQDALTRLMANRTSIVIAHRLSTIRHADMICVLDKGCVVEQGTHEELLKKDGLYTHLHSLQK